MVSNRLHALYKKLLTLYPYEFRELLGESMQQTFHDLCNEQKHRSEHGWIGFMVWMFLETAFGIIREHVRLIMKGATMKTILSNPGSAAITSLILCLPIGLTFIAFMLEIEQVTKPLTALFTSNGYDVNVPGRLFLIGGLLLIPVAFVINLVPIVKTEGPQGIRKFHAINMIVGAAILLLITFTWGGLLVEEIYCLRGIRCD